MKPGTAKQLHDAIEACDELQTYTSDWTRDEFMFTRSLQLIVWKLVDIMGDAVQRAQEMQPSLRSQIPEVDDVVERMRMATDTCGAGDPTLLWDIAVAKTPELRDRLAHAKSEAWSIPA